MVKKICLFMLVMLLAGCEKSWFFTESEDEPSTPVAEATQSASETAKPAAFDVGKVEYIDTKADGIGATPGMALNEAMKIAIMQVNGAIVDTAAINVTFYEKAAGQIDVETKNGRESAKVEASLQGQAFADGIIAQSGGIINSFKVTKVVQPEEEGGNYIVSIEAKVARFKAPEDNKVKIIVPPLVSEKDYFNIAGQSIPASEVLNSIRQQMIDALTNTGRFTVLDRQFDAQREDEFFRISEGRSSKSDMVKLGQEMSADLVWLGRINDFSYDKGRKTGHWSVSQRVVSLATSGIVLSSTVESRLPSNASDTYDVMAAMKQEFVKKTTDAIVLEMFPISIIKIEENRVVLSQGGNSVKENARYKIYLLGEELVDPQTGESLGRTEKYCCDVVITRVQPRFSEGILENVQIGLIGHKPGALQVREAMSVSRSTVSDTPADGAAKPAATKPRPSKPREPSRAERRIKADDKDW